MNIPSLQMLASLRRFIGPIQMRVMGDALRGEERQWFADKFAELYKMVESMPSTGETDGQGDAAIAHLRYFAGGQAQWFITEKDVAGPQFQAFGRADLFGDGGELGYINIVDIIRAGGELDLHWSPKPLSECE